MGMPADFLCEKTALLVAHIACRSADELGHGVLFLVFAHVEADEADAQLLRYPGKYRPHRLIALIALREHGNTDAADIAHFLRPSAFFYIEQKHARGIGYIRTMYARQLVGNIILGQHNFGNPCKILRFFVFHPENLGCRKTCKGDICRIFRQLFPADDSI